MLDNVYAKVGYFVTHNKYVICRKKETIDAIFACLRGDCLTPTYHTALPALGNTSPAIRVLYVRDCTTGLNVGDLPRTPDVHMITYTFDGNIVATLRTSGTYDVTGVDALTLFGTGSLRHWLFAALAL